MWNHFASSHGNSRMIRLTNRVTERDLTVPTNRTTAKENFSEPTNVVVETSIESKEQENAGVESDEHDTSSLLPL
jgi:hypothetical protein